MSNLRAGEAHYSQRRKLKRYGYSLLFAPHLFLLPTTGFATTVNVAVPSAGGLWSLYGGEGERVLSAGGVGRYFGADVKARNLSSLGSTAVMTAYAPRL